jgi:alpha-glucosidase
MRLIGDLTTNHCGSRHPWFETGRRDPDSVESDFFYWRAADPGYLGWCGVPSLPKLNWSSPELLDRMIESPDAVVRRWLQPPYGLDGWRIDVANMTGRHGADDRNHEIARRVRGAAAAARPDAVVIAEHGHDYTGDVAGDGWHGSMNYAGFLRPVWRWLADPATTLNFLGVPVTVRPNTGPQVVDTMSDFLGAVPWRVRCANLNQLGSHDTPRFGTVTGNRVLVEVGAVLLMTLPGIPAIFAGDEIGLEGINGEDARRPFPWDRREQWDETLLDTMRRLTWLRRGSSALTHGGLRWLSVEDDRLAFLRESASERILVVVARAGGEPLPLPPSICGATGDIEVLHGAEPRTGASGRIEVPGDGPAAHVWRLV